MLTIPREGKIRTRLKLLAQAASPRQGKKLDWQEAEAMATQINLLILDFTGKSAAELAKERF